MAESLNMAFQIKLTWDKDPEVAGSDQEPESPDSQNVMSRAAYREKFGHEFAESICEQL